MSPRGLAGRLAVGLGVAARRAGELLVAVPVALLGVLLWWLPERLVLALTRGLGQLAWWWWPTGRRVAMINLRRAYGPALDRPSARQRSRAAIASLGQALGEGVLVARQLRRDRAAAAHWWVPDDAALAASLLEERRPIVFATAHLGSWEALSLLLSAELGERGAGIARRVDNPFVDRLLAFVRRAGRAAGDPLIEKRGAVRPALAHLEGGGSVLLLADENAGPSGLFVPLFGRPASSWKTPAVLALATGARLVVGALVRPADGRRPYRLRLAEVALPPAPRWPVSGAAIRGEVAGGAVAAPPGGPVESVGSVEPAQAPLFAAGDPVRAATAAVQQVLEGWIRETPEQWRWAHWRFKHRPDGSLERYGRRELRAAFAAPTPAAGPVDAVLAGERVEVGSGG
jgi:KDO2-lipid IV(A) lauroyltransferase